MAEIYVLDDVPFGAPRFKTHLELARLCIGPGEMDQIKNASPNAWEWGATARNTLDVLANGNVSQSEHQRPIAKRMQAACELIDDGLPDENPELGIILSAVAQIFDAELEIYQQMPKLHQLKCQVSEATQALLSSGVRGVSLSDIEAVAASTT